MPRSAADQKFIDDFKEAIRAAELIAGRPLGEFLSEQGAILAGIAARDAPTGGNLGRLAGEAAALGTNIALLRAENSGGASSGAGSSGAGPGPPGVMQVPHSGPMVAAATPMVAADNFNSSSGFPGIAPNVFAGLNGRAQDQAMHSAFSEEAPLQEPPLHEMAEEMDLETTLMDTNSELQEQLDGDIFEGLPDEASEEEEAGSEFTDSFFH